MQQKTADKEKAKQASEEKAKKAKEDAAAKKAAKLQVPEPVESAAAVVAFVPHATSDE